MKELQSLALDVRVLRDDNTEVQIAESMDYEETDLRSIIEGDRRFREEEPLADYGFQKQEFQDDELVSVEEEEDVDGIDDSYEDFDDADLDESDEE